MTTTLQTDLTTKLEATLTARNISDMKVRLGTVFNVSSSIKTLYDNGTIDHLARRIMNIALNVTNDQKLDTWGYSNAGVRLTQATLDNIDTYTANQLLIWKGCWYNSVFSPVLVDINEYYFGSIVNTGSTDPASFSRLFGKPIDTTATISKEPIVIIFQTNSDPVDSYSSINAAINRISSHTEAPVFFMIMCMNTDSTPTFETPKDLSIYNDNVDYVVIPDITTVSDDDIFNLIISPKMAEWYIAHKV